MTSSCSSASGASAAQATRAFARWFWAVRGCPRRSSAFPPRAATTRTVTPSGCCRRDGSWWASSAPCGGSWLCGGALRPAGDGAVTRVGRAWTAPARPGVEHDRDDRDGDDGDERADVVLDRVDREEQQHDRRDGDRGQNEQGVAARVGAPPVAGNADEDEDHQRDRAPD